MPCVPIGNLHRSRNAGTPGASHEGDSGVSYFALS